MLSEVVGRGEWLPEVLAPKWHPGGPYVWGHGNRRFGGLRRRPLLMCNGMPVRGRIDWGRGYIRHKAHPILLRPPHAIESSQQGSRPWARGGGGGVASTSTYPSVPVEGLRLRMHERESRLVCLCKALGTRVRYGKDTQRLHFTANARGCLSAIQSCRRYESSSHCLRRGNVERSDWSVRLIGGRPHPLQSTLGRCEMRRNEGTRRRYILARLEIGDTTLRRREGG
jgi:hypothetical protein